jgi:hypothetical protein
MSSRDELAYGPSLKIQRAKNHINDLNRRIEAFLSEKPFTLFVHHQPKAGQAAARIKTEKPIPDEFGLIVGDAVHNLRSALDLTIYAMTSAKVSEQKLHKIEFPFPWKGAEGLDRAIDEGQVRFAGEKVVETVHNLKPYATGNRDLWGIRTLDNSDKHRLILLVGQTATLSATQLAEMFALPFVGSGGLAFHTDDAALINFTQVTYQGATRNQRRRMADFDQVTKIQPAFSICLRKGQPFYGQPVVNVLLKFTSEVESAVGKLIDAYRHPANKVPC